MQGLKDFAPKSGVGESFFNEVITNNQIGGEVPVAKLFNSSACIITPRRLYMVRDPISKVLEGNWYVFDLSEISKLESISGDDNRFMIYHQGKETSFFASVFDILRKQSTFNYIFQETNRQITNLNEKEQPQSDWAAEDEYEDYDDYGYYEYDRTPNDDRSDSMNPNNDAYQASMENRSNQMNPNNPTYWSSRGN